MLPKSKFKTHRLELLTWKDIAAYLKTNDKIILPIGSTEQHGPKCILGTDHLVSENIAQELGRLTQTLVSPTLPFGMSEHHMAFPGTISFSKEVYFLVVYNILSRLHRHGFNKIMLINGHGGNRRSVNAARYQLKNEFPKLSIALVNWWSIPDVDNYLKTEFGKWEGEHATPGETSIMMHYYPKIIKNSKVPKGKRPNRDLYEKAKTPEDFKRLFPSGVWYADPNLASATHGKIIVEKCIDYLLPHLKRWEMDNFLLK